MGKAHEGPLGFGDSENISVVKLKTVKQPGKFSYCTNIKHQNIPIIFFYLIVITVFIDLI